MKWKEKYSVIITFNIKAISFCRGQLSNSLFDFVKCKSMRSAAKYKYEIQKTKSKCFETQTCNTVLKQNARQLEDTNFGLWHHAVTHRAIISNNASGGANC